MPGVTVQRIFYEYINDYSYREAFYMAQKDIKNEYPDPYYWSSFLSITGFQNEGRTSMEPSFYL